jgi:hypothetical protein
MITEEFKKLSKISPRRFFYFGDTELTFISCHEAVKSVESCSELRDVANVIFRCEYGGGSYGDFFVKDILDSEYCDDEILKIICDSAEEYGLAAFVVENSNNMELLDKLDKYGGITVRSVIAECTTNQEVLRRLARDDDGLIRLQVAMNKYTPYDVIRQMAEKQGELDIGVKFHLTIRLSDKPIEEVLDGMIDDGDLILSAIEHMMCSPESLHKAALILNTKDNIALKYVSNNPNTSAKTLEYIYEHGDIIARSNAVCHTNVAADVVNVAAKDTSPAIRASAALSRLISKESLMMLADDPHLDVRSSVSFNRNMDADVVGRLLKRKCTYSMVRRMYNSDKIDDDVKNMVQIITGIQAD